MRTPPDPLPACPKQPTLCLDHRPRPPCFSAPTPRASLPRISLLHAAQNLFMPCRSSTRASLQGPSRPAAHPPPPSTLHSMRRCHLQVLLYHIALSRTAPIALLRPTPLCTTALTTLLRPSSRLAMRGQRISTYLFTPGRPRPAQTPPRRPCRRPCTWTPRQSARPAGRGGAGVQVRVARF